MPEYRPSNTAGFDCVLFYLFAIHTHLGYKGSVMNRSLRAITLLAVWLAMFLAGPVLPAAAVSCASSVPVSSSAPCPMEQDAVGETEAACCCPSANSEETAARLALQSAVSDQIADSNACACSVQSGDPAVPDETVQAPLPSLVTSPAKSPVIAAIPPLAHFAADAPLPPFAARLRLPLRALDAGRAPPIASRQIISSFV